MNKWRALKKGRVVFFQGYDRYRKKARKLSLVAKREVETRLSALQSGILASDHNQIISAIPPVQESCRTVLKRGWFLKFRDFLLGIGGALIIAILIRQVWFELYEIPTGSMRPTFKEQDRLSVSKVDFGLNYPFCPGHFYFDGNLLQRNGVVTFTVENMDVKDSTTTYFYFFPGKKLLIKRLIGKPGDLLYFYGGKIYGMDQKGEDLTPLLQLERLEHLDHIPFTHFEGSRLSMRPSYLVPNLFSPVVLYQMNEPIAQLEAIDPKHARGELTPRMKSLYPGASYGNLWGMNNFAMARLSNRSQLRISADELAAIPDAVLYLELQHSPELSKLQIGRDEYGRMRPIFQYGISVLPLMESDIKRVMEILYTARFVVKGGVVHRYTLSPFEEHPFLPKFSDIPDGTYEFYDGKAFKIGSLGISRELPLSHSIYRYNPRRVQQWFNLGTEFDTRCDEGRCIPTRYVYFRDGDLYVMGRVLMKKGEPLLIDFVEREKRKKERGVSAFIDRGAPLTIDGELDKKRIEKFGLRVPSRSYFVLGDNHAGSGDSRDFGFVPEENLKGGPVLIFWPPGNRIGSPNQPSYPLLNVARLTVWGIAGMGFGFWYYQHRRRRKLPISFPLAITSSSNDHSSS